MENAIVSNKISTSFLNTFKNTKILFFSAPSGYGKTIVLKELLKDFETIYISAEDLYVLDLKCKSKVLFIDNFSFINHDGIKKFNAIVESTNFTRIVVSSRATLPSFMFRYEMMGLLQNFNYSEFEFDIDCVLKCASYFGVETINCANILSITKAYPLHIITLLRNMSQNIDTNKIEAISQQQLYSYMNTMLAEFNEIQCMFIYSISILDRLHIDLAKIIQADFNVIEIISQIESKISIFTHENLNEVIIIPAFKTFLEWKARSYYTDSQIKLIYSRIALYNEMRGDLTLALDYYDKSGESERVCELLIKNSSLHVGSGNYFEMARFYFSLDEELVIKHPLLISSLSLLNALVSNFDKSEEMYQLLKNYSNNPNIDESFRKEAFERLVYLDIALPQRHSVNILRLFKKLFLPVSKNTFKMPQLAVTANYPSVINGGRDVSEWTGKDDVIYNTFGSSLEMLFGKNGVGLAPCGIVESKFEKYEDYHDYLLVLTTRLNEIQTKGSLDIEFAAVAIISRTYIAKGQPKEALKIMTSFKERVNALKENRFNNNIESFICQIMMRLGELSYVDKWLNELAPSETVYLWVLNRYCYLTKAMAFIINEDYDSARVIMSRLDSYVKHCHRFLFRISKGVIISICNFRQEKDWQSVFIETMDLAYNFRYIRPISEFGISILPLLDSGVWNKDHEYLNTLIKSAREYASYYPKFLKPSKKIENTLTVTEMQVLNLLCNEFSNNEICEVLGIKISTVKTHVSNVLNKLGVSRRTEVPSVAAKLGLVQL